MNYTSRINSCKYMQMSYDPEKTREAIKNYMEEHKLSATSWALDSGLSRSTLIAFLNKSNNSITNRTLSALAQNQGISIAQLIGEKNQSSPNEIDWSKVDKINVIGSVQAGAFKEALEWPQEERYVTAFAGNLLKYKNIAKYGLEVKGDSMNMLYPEGSILACISTIQNPIEFKTGQRVIVERRNKEGFHEATVKEINFVDGNCWLMPKSTNPIHAPIRLSPNGDGHEDDQDTKITGLVIGSYQPEIA
jgi:SOS-response transcriptional repressor LexA